MFARRETAHSCLPLLPSVKWCCLLTECQIVTGFLAQSQTWIEKETLTPQFHCISTGRAVARGSASFKCVRSTRSPPPRRLWSKPHLRVLLRRPSPSLSNEAVWNRERGDAQMLAERRVLESRAVNDCLKQLARLSLVLNKKKLRAEASAHTKRRTIPNFYIFISISM